MTRDRRHLLSMGLASPDTSEIRGVRFTLDEMSPRSAQRPPSQRAAALANRIAVRFGERIQNRREERRWTLAVLAKAARLSIGLVHKIDAGQPGSIDSYARLATALGLDLFDSGDQSRGSDDTHRDQDPVHAAMGEVEAKHLRRLGYVVRMDEPYQHFRFAGRADSWPGTWGAAPSCISRTERASRTSRTRSAVTTESARTSVACWPSVSGSPKGGAARRMRSSRSGHPRSFEACACASNRSWPSVRTMSRSSPHGGQANPAAGRHTTLVILDPVDFGRRDQASFIGLADLGRAEPRYTGYAEAVATLRRHRLV